MQNSELKVQALLLGCALIAGCKNDPGSPGTPFTPGDPVLLSTGSPTKDEDPSVLLTPEGRIFVAWFSDRGNNPDIYIASTDDGIEWTAPLRITTSANGDFNPSLYQDAAGTFHIAWFRWDAPFHGHIWYNSSPDGLTWDPADEVQVTRAFDVDDWVPTLTQAADGTILIYFVSETRSTNTPKTADLYVSARPPAATDWNAVVGVTGINSPTEHDHLPFARRTGDDVTLVWVRHDTSQPLPWLNPKSDLFSATSSDGLTFSTPVQVTNEAGNIVNLFPGIFEIDGSWSFVWLSTLLGDPRVFELPVAAAGNYPTGLQEESALPPGYSHKIIPTPNAGVYMGVWVQGGDGVQDIYYRFFAR